MLENQLLRTKYDTDKDWQQGQQHKIPFRKMFSHRRLYQSWNCRWFSSTFPKSIVHYLDLTGLSIIERLVLEEYLYQTHPQTNWLLIGTHGLRSELNEKSPWSLSSLSFNGISKSNNAAIVLGIGGKIPDLLYTEHVQQDEIPVIRRFSGGGTVLMNPNCIWTTIVGRDFPQKSPYYPRPLMEYTATHVFYPLFTRLIDQHNKLINGNDSPVHVKNTPGNLFALREHDYVWNQESKIAGNAQSIGKTGWLHHTSFLWHIPTGMSKYLKLPPKRPEYRATRSHEQFVKALAGIFPQLSVHDFHSAFYDTCQSLYQVESSCRMLSQLKDHSVLVPPVGGLEEWYQSHSRTKIITQF